MKCKKCGYESCSIITEKNITGKDYSIKSGCMGSILFGPLGVILGFREGKTTEIEAYWVCNKCRYKFKA